MGTVPGTNSCPVADVVTLVPSQAAACDSDLPASSFRYAFIIKNHNKNGVNKQYGGVWYYPKHEQLYWHSITHSQLINPRSGWINHNNDVMIEIELMKCHCPRPQYFVVIDI